MKTLGTAVLAMEIIVMLLAVPIAAPESIAALADAADEVIAVETLDFHGGISAAYLDFHQISDAEMLAMLAHAT